MQLEKMTQVAVLAPLAHLIVSFTFLFGYISGFGGGVGSLFSAYDMFAISLNDLVIAYLSGLIIPLLITAHMFVPGYKSAADRAIEQGEDIDQIRKSNARFAKLMIILNLIGVSLTIVPSIIVGIMYDARIPYAECNFFVGFFLPSIWLSFAAKLPTTRNWDRMISILLALVGASLVLGLSIGQGERRYPRSSFEDRRMHCGPYIVLRGAGDNFLAIDAEGGRVVIDGECKAKMKLPERELFGKYTTWELIKRALGFSEAPPAPPTKPAKTPEVAPKKTT